MKQIFDKINGSYVLPDGKTVNSNQLREDNQYSMLFDRDCVIDIVDGILVSYQPLSQLASNFGIEYSTESEDDPHEVLSDIVDQIEYNKKNPPLTITDTVRMAASFAALSFTDEQAIEVSDLYPVYEVGHDYKKDERFTYNGRLFKVNQDHTSAEQWVPGETGTESLYTCLEMAGDGYLVWTQPTGAHNAYNTGDIVHYPTKDDPLYKSKIDGNTTIPGSDERWWELYTES